MRTSRSHSKRAWTPRLLCILGFISLVSWRCEGAVLHVDGLNGHDVWDGSNWSSSKRTVDAALVVSALTAETDVIKVAAGTYAENLILQTPVILIGGYPPGGGERDHTANPTILDGGGIDRVITVLPDSAGSVIDGFTVTNGMVITERGGGIAILDDTDSNGEPATTIQNCSITQNRDSFWAGGGLYVEASATILKNHITSNSAEFTAGGIFVEPGCYDRIFIAGNHITDNEVTTIRDYSAGGIQVRFSDECGQCPFEVKVENNFIRRNQSGGAHLECCTHFHNNEVIGNQGKGVGIGPLGPVEPPLCPSEITHATIADNIGAGIGVQALGTAYVSRSTLWGNAVSVDDLRDVHFSFTLSQDPLPGLGNQTADPLFTHGPQGDYYLSQLTTGQPMDSPALNAGDLMAEEAGIQFRVTRIDGVRDMVLADLGFHYPPAAYTIYRGSDPASLVPIALDVQLPYLDRGVIADHDLSLLFYRVDSDEDTRHRGSGDDLEIFFSHQLFY